MGWINATSPAMGNVSTFWWWTGVILFIALGVSLYLTYRYVTKNPIKK